DRPTARETAEQPARQPEATRTRELAQVQQGARADGTVLLFRTRGRVADVRDLLVDVVEVGRQRHEHRRDLVRAVDVGRFIVADRDRAGREHWAVRDRNYTKEILP